MQTIKRISTFNVPVYALVLILALALAGVLAAEKLNISGSTAVNVNQPDKAEIVQPSHAANLSAVEQRQQIATMKEKQLQVQIPQSTVDSYTTRQELWQEHLDLIATTQAKSQSNAPSAYERYWSFKAEQIK